MGKEKVKDYGWAVCDEDDACIYSSLERATEVAVAETLCTNVCYHVEKVKFV